MRVGGQGRQQRWSRNPTPSMDMDARAQHAAAARWQQWRLAPVLLCSVQ